MTKHFPPASNSTPETPETARVSDDSARRAYVHDWIARRMTGGRLAGTGLVGAVLTLPMVAAAQGVTRMVKAESIDGVVEARVMGDGSAQLLMENGVMISIPAEDVRIAAAGDVLVSQRIVGVAADVMAAGVVEAGGVGGLVAAAAGGAAILGAAAAVGGGDGGGGGPAPLPVVNQSDVLSASGLGSGKTGFTPPEGSTRVEVTLTDEDGNETTGDATVDETGNWVLPEPAGGFPQGRVTVSVTAFDEDDGETGQFTQDLNVDTVPPVITITDTGVGGDDVLNTAEQGAGFSISGTTDAGDGQQVTVTLNGVEYTATAQGGAWSVTVPAADAAALADGATLNITAEVADAAGNSGADTDSFTTDFAAQITIDTIAGQSAGSATLDAADRVGGVDVAGRVTSVEDGRQVTLTVNGTDLPAVSVAGGGFAVTIPESLLNGLGDGAATLDISAVVSDAAGNPATATVPTIAADFTGPAIAISPIPTTNGDDTLNIAERQGGFEISGTTGRVAEGSTVTVTVNGDVLAGPVNVDGNGDWSVTVAQGDGGTFPQNGPVTIAAEVTDDGSGIPASAAPLDLDVDLEAPTVTITTPIAGADNTLNLAEQGAGITISGTTTGVEDTQQVEVRLFDGGTLVPGGSSDFHPAAVDGNGDWSVFIPDTTLDDFSGDGTIEVTANVSDAAGNPALEVEESLDRDLTPPTISMDDISDDNQIGLLDVEGDLEITGATNAEINQPVTLAFNGQEFTGSVISNGLGGAEPNAWSVTVSQEAVQAVRDGAVDGLASVDVTATVSDAAGNPATTPASATVSADFNGPSITINDIAGDNIVNLDESDDPIIISGTVNNVADTQDVTLNVGSLAPLTVGISGAAWQTSLTPQQATDAGLTDGATVNITADVTDSDGVPADQATAQITADFTAPVVFFDTVAESVFPGDDTDDFLNADALNNGMQLSGRATGAAGGTVEIFFGAGDEFPSTADVDANGNWSLGFTGNVVDGFFPAGTGDREQDFIVTAVDEAGNRSDPVTRTVTLDVTPPAVTIEPLPLGGDTVLNAAESGSDLVISGSATDTSQVTVTFNGVALAPAAVDPNDDSWSVTIGSGTLQNLDPEATIAITAEGTDAAGNTGSDTASFDTDFTPPALTVAPLAIGNFLNIADSAGGVSVQGTVSDNDGRPVTVSVGGFVSVNANVDGQGNWTANFVPDALNGLPSGQRTFSVATSDAAGNTANTASGTFTVDFTAPDIAFNDVPQGPIVLSAQDRDDPTIDFTTSESANATVTLTFTRADGTVDLTLTEQLGDITPVAGVFDFPLAEGALSVLEDETDYTIAIAIEDAAGNTGNAALNVATDFEPFIFLDDADDEGVVNLGEEITDPEISGTTTGVEAGQDVNLAMTGAGVTFNDTVQVQADGTWTVPIPQSVIDDLQPGETYNVTANVSNADGRAATAAADSFDAYLASVFTHANSVTAGTALTIVAIGNDTFNSNDGLDTTVTFNPAQATFVPGSATGNAGLTLFLENEDNAGTGTLVVGGGTAATALPPNSVVYDFELTDQAAGPITINFADNQLVNGAPRGGNAELQIGTSAGNTLTAANIDSTLQGKGGNDTLDVSSIGVNTVVFEAAPGDNGNDTVTGFTTGTGAFADQIAFAGLDLEGLRGIGTDVQALGTGAVLGGDTGFVIFTTQLADMDINTLKTAFEGLQGEATNDLIYFLAGDGTDAKLVRGEVAGTDNIGVTTMADFTGIGDLAALDPTNIILADTSGT